MAETNLMASIKKVGKGGKSALVIESEDLIFDPDDKVLAKAIANAMVVQIRDNLEKGLGPAFEPLPALRAGTLKWRDDEKAQGQRGGNASERYKDNAFRHQVRNNFERDYTAPRLGHFTPQSGGPRGVVSGMLVASFAARLNKDGKGVMIYVAAKRGHPRPAGATGRQAETKSALESVFADVPLWSPAAHNTPHMKQAMRDAASLILGKKDLKALRKMAFKLISEAAGVLEQAESFAEEAE